MGLRGGLSGHTRRMGHVRGKLSWPRLSWVLELSSIALGYAAYAVIRVLAPHQQAASFAHAGQVEDVESALGVFVELDANAFLAQHAWLSTCAGYYYATLHFIVTPLLLIWLWRRRQASYAPLRSALVLATGIALVVYAAWPLAPPRFALDGAEDSVIANPLLGHAGHGVSGLVNEFAAMPSMHVGWALWCAVAVVTATSTRWRQLAWLYPVMTTLDVVATANHYWLDAVAGAVVVLVPLFLSGALAWSSPARPQRRAQADWVGPKRSVPGALGGTAGHRGAMGSMRR